MFMAINWTKEKINELTAQEITALQENARVRGNTEVVGLCDEVLATKKPIRKARTASTTKTLEAECSHQLSELAKHLSSKYDLTAETATKKSEGVKGFRPHSLTAKNGQAKLGGEQRTGRVAMDRYISYRLKNDIVSLTAWLESKEDTENLKWQVRGPATCFGPLDGENISLDESGTVLKEFLEFSESSDKFEKCLNSLLSQ